MLLAAADSSGYKVVLVLHILAVVVAFSPTFVNPFVSARLKKEERGAERRFAGVASRNTRSIYLPAGVLIPIFGMALVGMSDKAYRVSQTWVWLSLVLWVAIMGLISGVVLPGERAVSQGDEKAESRIVAGGAAATVLFVVVVVLMVFKPGT